MNDKVKKGLAVACLGVALVSGGAAAALATTASYSAKLPGMQGNVTIATGRKSSSSSASATTKPTRIECGSAWQWLDDTSGRASDSKLTYAGDTIRLSYYNKSARSGISLRACTDGWKDPSIINGSVDFG